MRPSDHPVAGPHLCEVLAEVDRLHADLLDVVVDTSTIHPTHWLSARNLGHFLALRRRDRRPLQEALSELGLSSLGRCEPHVLSTVAAVHRALAALAGQPETAPPLPSAEEAPGHLGGRLLLERQTQDLLGPTPPTRWPRIMVTLPTEAATDPGFVSGLVDAGMDVARINCAHDDADAWEQMARHVRAAGAQAGRPVRIVMDLAGPKLRTTEIPDGPAVRKLRPERDPLGRVVQPEHVVITAGIDDTPDGSAGATIPVGAALFEGLVVGDVLVVEDARGARRPLDVVEVGSGRAVVAAPRTTYLTTGTVITRADGCSAEVGELPPAPGAVRLTNGQEIWLMAPGAPLPGDAAEGSVRVGCTLPEAISAARPGHRVFFDDGKIGGVIVDAARDGVLVRITRAGERGTQLRAEKGINLPDTHIPIPALTEVDREALIHVARLADAVALSFVRHPADVTALQGQLRHLRAEHLGIVLKIETLTAFQHLPEIVTAAMASEQIGIMIARGDLAVEVGYERLAEVQEEILWLCEAAHLPVIWATQVLDTLARTGQPSRAEITDAAMSERADCVMLNKGPHIGLAIGMLDDILHRMAGHQSKKRPLLRALRSWIRD